MEVLVMAIFRGLLGLATLLDVASVFVLRRDRSAGDGELRDDVRQITRRLKPLQDGSPQALERLPMRSTVVPCRPCSGNGWATCLAVGCGESCTTCNGTGAITCARCGGHGQMIDQRRAA